MLPCTIQTVGLSAVGKLAIEVTDPGAFVIYTEAEWPLLRAYIESSRGRRDVVAQASYVDLRAILRTFRQGVGRLPSVFGELLEQRIVKQNHTRQAFLQKLIDMNIVYREQSMYYLEIEKLAERGINWHSFFDGEPSETVLDLLVELNRP